MSEAAGRSAGVWRESFRVRSFDLDARGVLAPAALLRALQEAAGRHASALDVAVERLAREGQTWVLARLRIVLERSLAWQEDFVVETWPVTLAGLKALRDFELKDGQGRRFGGATSTWLVVDVARRRPVRIPAFVSEIVAPERPRALEDSAEKIPAPGGAVEVARVVARRSDCDLNGHVNNARYAEWLPEGWPEDVWLHRRLAGLDLAFIAECRAHETIRLETAPEGEGLLQRLVREHDDKEIARARVTFAG